MTHILHLGHQVTDLAGVEGRISTDAVGFDAELDVNCVRINSTNGASVPFSASWAVPTGDVWLGFRYRSPSYNAHAIGVDGSFLEFYDAGDALVAQVRTERPQLPLAVHILAAPDTSIEDLIARLLREASLATVDDGLVERLEAVERVRKAFGLPSDVFVQAAVTRAPRPAAALRPKLAGEVLADERMGVHREG